MLTTCQICGRDIKANTGVIAHHGYQRPGWGWQTDSCYGARELPYEESRDAIPRYIAELEQHAERQRRELAELIANPPVTIQWAPRSGGIKTAAMPDDFSWETAEAGSHAAYDYKHANGWKSEVPPEVRERQDYCNQALNRRGRLERSIKAIPGEIERLRRRYDGWEPKAVA